MVSIVTSETYVFTRQNLAANALPADRGALCGYEESLWAYFGKPRQDGSIHAIYKTPWPGDPRVNIQNAKGKAKPYQVRQVLLAIELMERIGKDKHER